MTSPSSGDLRVTGLFVHPLKSGAVREVTSVDVGPAGFTDDRSWCVVDADGVLVSARTFPELFHVVADTSATDPGVNCALRLRHRDQDELRLQTPRGTPVRVRIHANELTGVPAGPEADAWLAAAVGRDDLRLVWCHAPSERLLNPRYTTADEFTAFADGYPVTVATEASLRQLNDWIVETALARGEEVAPPLPMARFRPNLVLDGDVAFDEDTWTHVQVGEVRFRATKPSERCVMTMVDPETLARSKEPIRTLAKHRRPASATLFALNLVPETTGRIAVGDHASVTRVDAAG